MPPLSRPWPLRAGILGLLLSLAALLPGPGLAQTPPPEQLKQAILGPYRITVISRPPTPVAGLGGPRFTVEVVAAQDSRPVTDAQVTIALTPPEGGQPGEVKLDQNPSVRQFYEGRLTLARPGLWSWQVAVNGSLGLEVLDGTIRVNPAPAAGRTGLIAWGAMLGALLLLVALAYLNLRPRKRGRGTGNVEQGTRQP